MTPQEAMAAALHAIGGFADDFPRPTAAEREDAVDLLAALAASGWTLAPVQPAPDHLGPDDHGHTGRLWCDPCVAHGVMLEQGIHHCANTVSSGNASDAPTPDPLSDAPDHILDGLTCWCRPYPDREDPEVIIHRMEVKA